MQKQVPMSLTSKIFQESKFYKDPFPHWISTNFFSREELEIINNSFPKSIDICNSLRKAASDLVLNSNGNSTQSEAAQKSLMKLGYGFKTPKIDILKIKDGLKHGKIYPYKMGKTYSLQLGINGKSIYSEYSEDERFNKIICNLEKRFWESSPEIVDILSRIMGWNLSVHQKAHIFTRGDLRASSPSPDPTITTLGPHIDSCKQILAGLIYLRHPSDDSLGGSLALYRKKNECPQKYMSRSGKIPMKYLEKVKEIPYSSNNAIFFINTPNSIHSVSPRERSQHDRRIINLTIECEGNVSVYNQIDIVDDKLSREKRYGHYTFIRESDI